MPCQSQQLIGIKNTLGEMNHTREFDVIVVGELNADLILNGDIEPRFDQVEKLIGDAALTLGSSSAIFACGASRLGLRTAFIGKVGDDIFGQFVIDQLEARDVFTAGIIRDKNVKTGLSVILNRESDRAILTYSGSIGALKLDEIDLKLLSSATHLHLGGYFLLDELRPDLRGLFRMARDFELTISLDTNFDPNEKWNGGLNSILRSVDIFLPNEREICAITRKDDLLSAANLLVETTPTVVVKLGAKGGQVFQKGKSFSSDILKVDVVDTVGAGDSFDAGYIFAFLNSMDLQQSIRLACICGSLSTRASGGITGQPTWEEAKKYL